MEEELLNVVYDVIWLVLHGVLLESILDAADVLNEDVVACDDHLLLLLFLLARLDSSGVNATGRLILCLR
jgi:hypothetical protein